MSSSGFNPKQEDEHCGQYSVGNASEFFKGMVADLPNIDSTITIPVDTCRYGLLPMILCKQGAFTESLKKLNLNKA
jgi:hypothetical protein